MSWTDNTDFIDASYAGTITILKGKRFFYDETEMFAKAEGLYKQEKKIIPAVLDNSLLSSGEILMQRNFVTTEGTAVDVSYDVYDYNGDKLTDGTDYTAVIKNSNNQIVTTFDQLGDYTLTVTGMGNYSGSNSYTFSLVEWDMALMQDGSEHYVNLPENGTKTVYLNVGQSIIVYDSEGKDGKLVASDGRLLLHVPTGYALVVSGKTDAMKWNEAQHDTTNFLSAYENENFTDEITSLFGNSDNISFASAGNSMLIRLNAQNIYRYADQYGLELTISVQKSLTHSDITIATIPDQTYSGSEICPAVIVNDGETKLTLGTDYTVEYSDNVSAGTAKITITGAGDYTGSILKTFEILKAEPTIVKAPTAVENLVYNGSAQELVTAGSTDFGTVLYSLDGETYSETIPKGTDAGTYTVYYKVESSDNWNAVESQTVTAKIGYTDGIGERLMGYSLSLEGDIGVNFYMELDDAVIADENAYMQFTLPNGDTPKVPVGEAAQETIGGKTYYVFKCNVAAKEMTDTITAQMFSGDKPGQPYEYTVKEYADYLFANAYEDDGTTVKNQAYVDAIELVESMVNYGAYSQLYFNHNTDSLANAGLDDDDRELGDVNVEHSEPAVNDLPEGVTFEGANLSLESETRLSLYFKNISENEVTFKLGDKNIEPVDNNGYLQINITGIKASDLSKDFTITVGDTGSVTYSPLNYCKIVLDGNYSDSLKNVVKALYRYSQAADIYTT